MNDIVMQIATVPTVLAVVTLAKDLGLPTRWAPMAAVVTGMLAQLYMGSITATAWPVSLAAGLMLGLAASGVYDAARISKVTQQPEVPREELDNSNMSAGTE